MLSEENLPTTLELLQIAPPERDPVPRYSPSG
jgi:hypothetical protein